MELMKSKWVIRLAYAQAAYFLITGLWPLIDIGTFEIATGPKIDIWLVRTVGALVTCTAIILIFAARAREVTRPVALLAMTNAVALTAIDVIYVSRQVIKPVYLADAALELLFLLSWIALWPAGKKAKVEEQPLNRFDRQELAPLVE